MIDFAAAARRAISSPASDGRLPAITIAALAGFATIAVYQQAWISEDAFITLRYVSNLLDGYGPVFNVGEQVQGYTHPLWFLLLVPFHAIITDPVYLVVGMGLVLTVLTIGLGGKVIFREARNLLVASASTAAFTGILLSSESWRSFQTGGLENALSHLLIVAFAYEVFRASGPRPLPVSLLISLLLLNRPDFLPLVAPVAVVRLLQSRTDKRELVQLAAGLLPLAVWVAFSLVYYDTVIPNTATAKVGILGSWLETVVQGLAYLFDWVWYEPLPALASIFLLVVGLTRARRRYEYAYGLGALLYLLYVIYVGGDFMRGRFLLAFLVAASLFGILSLARWSPGFQVAPRLISGGTVIFIIAALLIHFSQEPPNASFSRWGIVNERQYYPGLHLAEYRRQGEVVNRFVDTSFTRTMSAYAEKCGSLTVHSGNVGTLGYYVGPKVHIIDIYGLTDSFVAHLPNSELVRRPRVGHPVKYVPLSYFASKGDITIFRGWDEAIRNGDCDFREKAQSHLASTEKINPHGPFINPAAPFVE